jgi:hypothetical protein
MKTLGASYIPHITLYVTEKIRNYADKTGTNSRQIAFRDPSPDLHLANPPATSGEQVLLAVNGVFKLSVGDTYAIWATHQSAGIQAEDFTSLYDLLARRPECQVRFEWASDN